MDQVCTAHMKLVGFETISLLIRLPFLGDTLGPDGDVWRGGELGGMFS